MTSSNGRAPAAPIPNRLRVLSLVVEDHPGVLERVASQVRRRGFNIASLSVGPIAPGRSRMTVTVDAGHAEVDQVEKQLDRLIEVVEVTDLTESERFHRELLVGRADSSAAGVLTIHGARVVHQNGHGVLFEFVGDERSTQELIEKLTSHGLRELTRSGPVAVRRH